MSRSRDLWFLCALVLAAPLAAQRPDAVPAATALVRGVVHDSVAGVPLAGAMVQLVPDETGAGLLMATSDSTGRFEMRDVPTGSYLAGFFHEDQEALGVSPRVYRVRVAPGDTIRLRLTTPSSRSIHAALCGTPRSTDSTGGVLGVVRDADTGSPLPGSLVALVWPELVIDHVRARAERRQVTARANADGWFAVCGIPHDADLAVRAERGADSSGFVALSVPLHGIVRQVLRIGRENTPIAVSVDSSGRSATLVVRRGTARLTGRVVRGDGTPIGDAQLSLWGSDAAAISAGDGSFTMSALPVGTYTLEARLVGFEPTRVGVQLRRESTTTVTVRIEKPIPILESVVVYGTRRPTRLTEALKRRERGWGSFFTYDQIHRAGVSRTTDLLATVPGVRVLPAGSRGYTVLMRGNCVPVLWVDGMPFVRIEDQQHAMPSPHEIAMIEVYKGSEAPAQFNTNGCGAVVIWTGR